MKLFSNFKVLENVIQFHVIACSQVRSQCFGDKEFNNVVDVIRFVRVRR